MTHRPWDRAQPDEWLPRSLRLCWGGGGGGDGGGGYSGDGGGFGGGGFGDAGFSASTGGGDWGSSGSYDASGFMGSDAGFYSQALADSPGGYYDTGGPGIAPGALGAEFGGTFGTTGISGQPGSPSGAFGSELDAGGGGTSGVGRAIASWNESTPAGAPGAGTNAAYALSGGMFGDYGGGGGYTGGGGGFSGYPGGGGGYPSGGGGGGGRSGNAPFSGGGRSSVTDSTPGYFGTVSGGKDVTPSETPSKSEAPEYNQEAAPSSKSEDPSYNQEAAPEAQPEATPEPSPGALPGAEPSQSEATPSPEPGASPGRVSGGPEAKPSPDLSAFGPQSVSQTPDYQGSPYADMGTQQSAEPSWGSVFEGAAAPQVEPGLTDPTALGVPNFSGDQWGGYSKAADIAQNFISSHPFFSASTWLSPPNQQTFNEITNIPSTLNSILNPSVPTMLQAPSTMDLQALSEQGKGQTDLASQLGIENIGAPQGIEPGAEQYGTEAYAPGGIDPGTAQYATAPDLASQLGIENISSVPWGSVFEGAAPDPSGYDPTADRAAYDFGGLGQPHGQTDFGGWADTPADTTMESPPGEPTSTDTTTTLGGDPALSGKSVDAATADAAAAAAAAAVGAPGAQGVPGAPPAAGGQTFATETAVTAITNASSIAADKAGVSPEVGDAVTQAAYNATLNLNSPTEIATAVMAAALEKGATQEQADAIAAAVLDAATSQPAFTPGQPGQQQQAPPGLEQPGAPVGTPTPQTTPPTTAPPSLIEQMTQPSTQPSVPMPQARPAEAPQPPATPMPQARPADAPQPGQVGEPDHDEEGEPQTPAQPGRPLGAPTTNTQNTPVVSPRVIQEQQGSWRNRPVSEALHGILSQAAEQANVTVRVGSGGQVATRSQATYRQVGGWTGSVRHNHGNAADVRLEQNGRILSFNNPQDRVVMENFVREAARLGATGQGAGMRYMQDKTIHVGFGGTNFWRADNPGSRGLRQAWAEGLQGPRDRPPGDIPARQAPTQLARPAAPPGGWRGIGGDISREARMAPADVPQTEVTMLPPQDAPPAPRPPADIPIDIPVQTVPPAVAARTAQAGMQFAKFLSDNLTKSGKLPSNREEGQVALNALAQELAKAGYPASVAQKTILETATQGSIKAGYGPNSAYNTFGSVTRAINEMAATAMQGYRTGKMPEAQGPPTPADLVAPGKRSEAPFGQQFADLSQSVGPPPANTQGRQAPSLQDLSPLTAPPAPPPTWGQPPAPPPPPMYKPGDPGMFNPFRGNEASLPFGAFHLAAGGRDVGEPPAIEPGQQPGRAEWESSRPGARMGADPNVVIEGPEFSPPSPPPAFQAPDPQGRGRVLDPDVFNLQQEEQQNYQQQMDPRGQQRASLFDLLQNFNPISTAEARGGRSQAGNLQAPRADPGVIQGRLASARAGIVNDLQNNLGLRNTLDLVVTGEVGSQGKAAVRGFLETAMNKVAAEASRQGREATGRDLLQYLNDRNYFPDTWGKIESGKIKGGAVTDALLSEVGAGSNTTKGSTGNSVATSPGSRFGGNPTNVTIGKEHYGVENYGHHIAWYNALGALPSGRGIGSDFAVDPQDMPTVGAMPPADVAPMRGLAKGGRVDEDEPVVVGEEGPETFVPDQPGTILPHVPRPGQPGNIDRWPKIPAVGFPGQYGGVEREMRRQTRVAQDPVPSLMDMIDSGRLRLNAANWHRMLNDPYLIALGRSRMEERRPGY